MSLSRRHLDRNNIVIIGTVMAQTVALDHYAESVERMIVSFMRMNMKIEQSGNFDLLDKKEKTSKNSMKAKNKKVTKAKKAVVK